MLERMYPDTPTKRLAKLLGRTAATVYNRAQMMGLRKSGSYISAVGRSTGFKTGNHPKNRFPVGEQRIHNGYPYRKLTNTGTSNDWRPAQDVVWEKAHGHIPPGHAVGFINGDKTDIRLTNLVLLSRADLMRRNSYHNNYPPEICHVIQLRGALNRAINRKTREANA